MAWNMDMATAPKGRPVTRTVTHTAKGVKEAVTLHEVEPVKVWLASKCGKVILSHWVESGGRWSGFVPGEHIVGWHEYVIPEYPSSEELGEAA